MASCHTHAANQTIFPQNPTQPNYLCASVKSVGGSSPPEASVNWENPTQPKHLCASVRIRGRLFYARSFCEFREFRGRTLRNHQTICVDLCHLWEECQRAAWVWQGCHTLLSVLCWRTPPAEKTKRAWRNAMPSYVSYVDAWVWQGCHTLL